MVQLVYRGTQRREQHGVRGATSWTDSLPVALIWAAVPADPWSSSRERQHAHFIDTSTVHAAHLALHHPLVFDYNSASVTDVLRALGYGAPNGITHDEARKVFNYLHNRIYGKAAGGEFSYVIMDEDGDELDPDDAPFSLTGSSSYILDLRDEFEYAGIEVAERLQADVYVFFDSKTVQAVARRLGFDGFVYPDIFQGCEYAARDLFGPDVECDDVRGISDDRDVKGETVWTHRTYRPLVEGAVVDAWASPVEDLLPELPKWLR